jgi:site-specific recombinase XerD
MAGKPTTVRIHGPLQPYAQGFAAHLLKQGYAEGTVMHHMYLLAHASAWLTQQCLDPMELGREQVDEYLRDRRAEGKTRRNSRRGLAPLLQYLRELGAAPEPVAPCTTNPLEKIVEEFTSHIWRERGLAGQTIVYYRRVGVMFLSTLRSAPTLEGLADMTVADMSAFLLDQSRHMGDGALGNVVTGLRALLRFLHLRGYIPTPMASTVFSPPGWQRDSLPKALDRSQVATLLESIEHATSNSRRDYAVLLLLVRLGLRGGEVAGLTLDDVNWRSGEISVSGKARRRDLLPMPVDVGQALAQYCERRPRHPECRSLFLQDRAPHAPLSRVAITALVYRASIRAGLPRIGPHRLRHTAATEMRRAGVTLTEIGQVLRHRDVQTTALYARDDMEALRSIAAPWPGGVA